MTFWFGVVAGFCVAYLFPILSLLRRLLYLCTQRHTSSAYVDLSPALLNCRVDTRPSWINLGYWVDAVHYDQACANLAVQLGERAALRANDVVLDVGCGRGDQLVLWAERWHPRCVVGINISDSEVQSARALVQSAAPHSLEYLDGTTAAALQLQWQTRRMMETEAATRSGAEALSAVGCITGDAAALPGLFTSTFSVVLSLDSAYHYRTRTDFFAEAARCLVPNGRLAVADCCLARPWAEHSAFERAVMVVAAWAMGIPTANLYDLHSYCERVRACGFEIVSAETVPVKLVFGGFADFVSARTPLFAGAAGWVRFEWAAALFRWLAQPDHHFVDFVFVTAAKRPVSQRCADR